MTILPSHIAIDDKGVARIAGTGIKVVLLIREMLARGETAEQILRGYPQLSLAQVHAALSYYYDHKDEVDAEIRRRADEAEALRAQAEETPGRKRLRDMGLRP
jgi:uncharacterized protein (DUF433 family)